MQDNQPRKSANPMYNSVAYHYLYGQHQLYGSSHNAVLYPVVPAHYANRFFSSGTPITKIDEGPQTVEQLVEQGYISLPASEPEIAILTDRKHTSWLGLEDVIGQIRQRREIYQQNMTGIEWGKCYAFNEMAKGGWPATSQQEEAYAKSLQDLHAQQRNERVAYWRDISRLKQILPESAQQYLSAFRKTEILKDTEGDMP